MIGTTPVLELTAEPAGKSTHKIVVKFGGDVVCVDTVNLSRDRNREKFSDTLTEKFPGIDREQLSAELLKLSAAKTAQSPSAEQLQEVDVCWVVRPELFHTPYVSGIVIPATFDSGGKLGSRWRLYLQWGTGKREVIDLPDRIVLPDKSVLFFQPDPGEPPESEPPRWSARSREEWLTGTGTPDPGKIFRRLCQQVAYYLDFPHETAPGTAATIALWVILTYVFPAWDSVPYLSIGGPAGSGKTRVLDVIERLVFRPICTSNMTAACLFRSLHARGGTLLYDEAEQLRQSTPEAGEKLSVLLAGYKKGGTATRLEPVGDSFRPTQFQVYGPKVLACIAGLPPTLASRCIPVLMFRSGADSEKPKRRLDEDPTRWEDLRADLHALALGYGSEWARLSNRRDVVPKKIGGRNAELWQPILAIGGWLQDRGAVNLLTLLQKHALASVESTRDDAIPEADELLLELLADAVRVNPQSLPTPGEMLKSAKEKDETTFKLWSAAGVSRRLKSYGIPTPKKSNGVRRYQGVTVATMQRIGERYGIDLRTIEGADTPP
jgi:hypothetical protein